MKMRIPPAAAAVAAAVAAAPSCPLLHPVRRGRICSSASSTSMSGGKKAGEDIIMVSVFVCLSPLSSSSLSFSLSHSSSSSSSSSPSCVDGPKSPSRVWLVRGTPKKKFAQVLLPSVRLVCLTLLLTVIYHLSFTTYHLPTGAPTT